LVRPIRPGIRDPEARMEQPPERHANRLANESSPYLLQHAHNPVDWFPWGEEALRKARTEDRLMLVSIGYSSCHWCHVMERECFEDPDTAAVMNAHFVCIKVDREERPDIDQVYMNAVQLMGGQGGWPLNCFTLPDGRPLYGGTYFPKEQWLSVLQQLADTWANEPAKATAYAERVHARLRQTELIHVEEPARPFSRADAEALTDAFARHFDEHWGGADRVPKFPMPNNLAYLLRHALTTGNKQVAQHVRTTLDRMAQGGIFDQAGGGFARYSTDQRWKVPHFEKMLYDNAQLISLYSLASRAFRDEAYRDVAERTIAWAQREMLAADGSWHSALDADSEGEEGRFYTWTREEIDTALGADAEFAAHYYQVDGEGLWEHGRSILFRDTDDRTYAERNGLDPEELRRRRDRVNAALLREREERVRPACDDKAVTSWNALMVSALCDAHEATGNMAHLELARRTMRLLLTACRRPDGGLWHILKNGKAHVNGYLEDLSFTAEALIALYQVTFDESWLTEARQLAEYAIENFLDEGTGLFRFTSKLDTPLIARTMELHDNVVPASNSSMAKALFTLGQFFEDERLLRLSQGQLVHVAQGMTHHPGGHSNWGLLLLDLVHPNPQIAITGPQALAFRQAFFPHYTPGARFIGGTRTGTLPLLEGKWKPTGTWIHVCEGRTCRRPVQTVEEALTEIG
jgi:uncharacterized protein YyaL (SSP411 family)